MDPDVSDGIQSLRLRSLDDDHDDDDHDDDDNGEYKEEIEGEEIVDYGDDDEDDDEQEGVSLGFVEKKDPQLLLRHLFPSKAGGLPAWLDPVDLPSQKSRSCGFCGEPLQFLLQVYAPISEKESTFHRMLYVFMCPSMSCLLQDQHEQWKDKQANHGRSVKVFRCQLPRANPFYSTNPPSYDGKDKPLSTGAALCSWCGTWKGEKVCSSCRRAHYCSEKHQVMHWKSGHKNECCRTVNFIEASNSTPDIIACRTSWPEYEIIVEDESAFDTESTEPNSCVTSLVSKSNKADEMYQLLLEKRLPSFIFCFRSLLFWHDNFDEAGLELQADKDKRSWASFQERVTMAPEQVLRYCRDPKAKPLWPLSAGRPSKANIPACKYCNKSSLCFEFQVMPQLLYYFDVRNDPDSLDWGTIAIYTCLDSCEAGESYKEEFAWVQLYPANKIA